MSSGLVQPLITPPHNNTRELKAGAPGMVPGGPCSEAYRGFKPREYMPLSLEQNLELSSNRSRTGGVQFNGPYPDNLFSR